MRARKVVAVLAASLLLAACGTQDVAFHSSTGELTVDVLSFNIRFNTHFDHVSQPSRERSAEMLASLIANRRTEGAVIVTGDFNAGEDNPAIHYLKNANNLSPVTLVDTFRALRPETQAVGTGGGIEGRRDGPKIDCVFVEPGTRVLEAGSFTTTRPVAIHPTTSRSMRKLRSSNDALDTRVAATAPGPWVESGNPATCWSGRPVRSRPGRRSWTRDLPALWRAAAGHRQHRGAGGHRADPRAPRPGVRRQITEILA